MTPNWPHPSCSPSAYRSPRHEACAASSIAPRSPGALYELYLAPPSPPAAIPRRRGFDALESCPTSPPPLNPLRNPTRPPPNRPGELPPPLAEPRISRPRSAPLLRGHGPVAGQPNPREGAATAEGREGGGVSRARRPAARRGRQLPPAAARGLKCLMIHQK